MKKRRGGVQWTRKLLYHIEKPKKPRSLCLASYSNSVQIGIEDFLSLVRKNGLTMTAKERCSFKHPFEVRTKLGDYTIFALVDEEEVFKFGLQSLIKEGLKQNESI